MRKYLAGLVALGILAAQAILPGQASSALVTTSTCDVTLVHTCFSNKNQLCQWTVIGTGASARRQCEWHLEFNDAMAKLNSACTDTNPCVMTPFHCTNLPTSGILTGTAVICDNCNADHNCTCGGTGAIAQFDGTSWHCDELGNGSCSGISCDDIPSCPNFCSDVRNCCIANGQVCASNNDCCSTHCVAGTCSASACLANSISCTNNADCCSTNCVSGSCSATPACTANSVACTNNIDCCSAACVGSVCVANGSILTAPVCVTIDPILAEDDNYEFFISSGTTTLVKTTCHCSGSCSVTPSLSFQDRSGNAISLQGGGNLSCPSGTGNDTWVNFDSADTDRVLVDGEGLRFNTLSTPTTVDRVTLCIE